MRGYVLSHPDVLRAMKPYVITHWNGHDEAAMPEAVRDICTKTEGVRSIQGPLIFFVYDPSGAFVRVFPPYRKGNRMEPDRMHRDLLEQLQPLAEKMGLKPDGAAGDLRLPDIDEGVRIFLQFRVVEGGQLNYQVPVCEVSPWTDAARKALEYSDRERTVDASALRAWLELVYPPAIMDGRGKPKSISGSLSLTPAGPRAAILRGEVSWTMDNRTSTRYRGTIELALAYESGSAACTTVRGVIRGTYPKADRQGTLEFDMTAAIESRPK